MKGSNVNSKNQYSKVLINNSSSNFSKKTFVTNNVRKDLSESPPPTHQDFLNLISAPAGPHHALISTEAQRENIRRFVLSQQTENDAELIAISIASRHQASASNVETKAADYGSFVSRTKRPVCLDDLSELTTPEDHTSGGQSSCSLDQRNRNIIKVLDELTDHELADHLERVVRVTEERRILHNASVDTTSATFTAPYSKAVNPLPRNSSTWKQLAVPPPTPYEGASHGLKDGSIFVGSGLSPKSFNYELCTALSNNHTTIATTSYATSLSATTSAGVSISGDSMFVSVDFSREKRQRSRSNCSDHSHSSVKKPVPVHATRTPIALRHNPCFSPPAGVVTMIPMSATNKVDSDGTGGELGLKTWRPTKFVPVTKFHHDVYGNQKDVRSAAVLLRKGVKNGRIRAGKSTIPKPIAEEEEETTTTSPLLRRQSSRMTGSPSVLNPSSVTFTAFSRRSPVPGKVGRKMIESTSTPIKLRTQLKPATNTYSPQIASTSSGTRRLDSLQHITKSPDPFLNHSLRTSSRDISLSADVGLKEDGNLESYFADNDV